MRQIGASTIYKWLSKYYMTSFRFPISCGRSFIRLGNHLV